MVKSLDINEVIITSFRNIIIALAILNACALIYYKQTDPNFFKPDTIVVTDNRPITNKYYDQGNGKYYFVVDNVEHNVHRKVYNNYNIGSNVSLTVSGEVKPLHELMFLFFIFSIIGSILMILFYCFID